MNYEQEALNAAKVLGINFAKEKFTLADLAAGIKVEYEHGTSGSDLTNVTNDDPLLYYNQINHIYAIKP